MDGLDHTHQLVGREREAAALGKFLDSLRERRVGVVLEGEAGIGKTALWRYACQMAVERHIQVLRSQPTETEAQLSFLGLADLLSDSLEPVIKTLPGAQAHALEIALRREDPMGTSVDRHAVAAGFRSALMALAKQGPVLVAVDDVQWLDRPSADVLGFALRRLGDEPVGLLLTRRSGPSEPGEPLVSRMRIGPLDLDELHNVIRIHLGQVPPRPTLTRIAHASGGNPLYALEITRAVIESGWRASAANSLPIPESVGDVLQKRIATLPRRSREALLLSALSATPTTALLDRIIGSAAEPAIARAEEAGVVAVTENGTIEFTHPLVAVAAQASASRMEYRSAHRHLANEAVDLEERAHHLALSAQKPSAKAARSLDAAARHARVRGATDAAADLTELAIALTPPSRPVERSNRRLLLGEYLFLAGDTERARSALTGVADGEDDRIVKARALLLLARIEWLTGTSVAAAALGERALASGVDATLEAETRTLLAYLYKHDRRRGMEHARRACSILEGLPNADPGLLARALFAIVYNESDLGLPLSLGLAERALALEAGHPASRVADRVGNLFANVLWERDEIGRARVLFEEALAAATEEGDEGSLPRILDQLGQLEVVAGRWKLARRYAQEQFDVALRAGQEMQRLWGLETLASVDAHEGHIEKATARIEDVLETVRRVDDPMSVAFALRTQGFIAFSIGDLDTAVESFSEADEITDRIGVLTFRHWTDHIEARIELGELDRAESLLNRAARRARVSGSRWARAETARCRALLSGADGDLDGAGRHADRAVATLGRLEMPFYLARALLTKGQVHRRRREKRLAGEALDRAQGIFVRLEAAIWTDRARTEKRRLGLRPRAPQHLTETEGRVTALAARGLTNPEIAARLFISRKTVETNLSKAYHKLGIRGRGQLAAHFARSGDLPG